MAVLWMSMPPRLAGVLPGVLSRGVSPAAHLTLDDGPTAETPALLKLLAQLDSRVTFFLSGGPEMDAGLVCACRDAGHRIGSHGAAHADAWRVSARRAVADLEEGTTRLEDALGAPVDIVRPPYGHLRPATWRWARRSGRTIMLWSLMPGDFRHDQTPESVAGVLADRARPGEVLVLHEGLPHTLETVRRSIGALRDKGLTLDVLP